MTQREDPMTRLQELITRYKAGDAPFEELEGYLAGFGELHLENADILAVGPTGRLDPGRAARSGVPEAVFAEGKRPQEVVEFLRAIVRRNRFGRYPGRPEVRQRGEFDMVGAVCDLRTGKVRFLDRP
jgi:hypothetical protein